MLDPNSAQLLERKLQDFYAAKEALEKKLEEVKNDEDLYVANHCIINYFKDKKGDIKEERNILNVIPLSEIEAKALANEVNNLKELPNVTVISYQELLVEAISEKSRSIALLQKSH